MSGAGSGQDPSNDGCGTQESPRSRFTPRHRHHPAQREDHDVRNLRHELSTILLRTQAVTAASRDSFHEGSETYDVASMVIIRLAALLERPGTDRYLHSISAEERLAVRTTRNIAAHAGYQSMDDDLFWLAVTERVPEIVHRLLDDLGSEP